MIVAMLMAALAAAAVIAMAGDQQRWLALVAGRRDQVQAQSLALAGVQWTRAILFEDQGQGPVDWLGEPWALPLPPTPLESGFIEGRIVDAQGLLNVNNVRAPDGRADAARAMLARLFAARGVPVGSLDALAAYIGAPGTAADPDAWYRAQATPYVTAAAPLLRVAELAAVRGFDDARLTRVQGDLAALPDTTALNVNTAPPAVLAAALGTSEARIGALVEERRARPFASIADLRSRLPEGVTLPDERLFGVASRYFVVTVRARQGDSRATARALIARHPNGWPSVVWQTLE